MPPCCKCGHDPDAPVGRSWTIRIQKRIESANGRTTNTGASRWRYAEQRDAWVSWLQATAGDARRATGRRRVTITRRYARKQREMDHDNLVAGTKSLRDAMKRVGVIVDDHPDVLECHVLQERSDRSETELLIEEIG